jgi:hypothetical protein
MNNSNGLPSSLRCLKINKNATYHYHKLVTNKNRKIGETHLCEVCNQKKGEENLLNIHHSHYYHLSTKV